MQSYRFLHIKGKLKILKLFFVRREKGIREDSKSISKQGIDGNKGFKTSIKDGMNIKDMNIVERKISRSIE